MIVATTILTGEWESVLSGREGGGRMRMEEKSREMAKAMQMQRRDARIDQEETRETLRMVMVFGW